MVTIDQSLCVGCGACAADCLRENITLTAGKAAAGEECLLCGHCVAVCPTAAVSIPAYDMADIEPCTGEQLDPQAVLRAIKSRRSIRRYKPDRVSQADLEMLIQAGRYTATAKNNQGCRFIFVQDGLETLKEQVWNFIDALEDVPPELEPFAGFNQRRKADPSDDYLFRNAPAVLYITSDWPLDAGLAAQNVATMAAALGMGTLFNGYLARISELNKPLKNWLGAADTKIKACLLLGYPDRQYRRTAPRKPANLILR